MKAYERLQAHWGNDPAFATKPLSEDEVSAIERRLGVSFPADFRDYVRFACPDVHGDEEAVDDKATTWWPRSRLISIAGDGFSQNRQVLNPAVTGNPNKFIFFADWVFWCGAWAVDCSASTVRGRVANIGGKEDPFVAHSFTEFVDKYLDDWWNVI